MRKGRLGRHLLIGILVPLLLGVGLTLVGFELDLPFWTLLGLLIAVVAWFSKRFVGYDEPIARSLDDGSERNRSLNLDRRVRMLESRLWGNQPQHRMNATEVHHDLTLLADQRLRGRPMPPALADYLDHEPRPLGRAQLRTLLKELMALDPR